MASWAKPEQERDTRKATQPEPRLTALPCPQPQAAKQPGKLLPHVGKPVHPKEAKVGPEVSPTETNVYSASTCKPTWLCTQNRGASKEIEPRAVQAEGRELPEAPRVRPVGSKRLQDQGLWRCLQACSLSACPTSCLPGRGHTHFPQLLMTSWLLHFVLIR